ncbi:MAG: YlmC/YmxH family sporulation protein [Oscillospiraceae bacterium]|nr:YlmC/YmxH family sporulation protein [Oscillospiraceae bacterium]
MINIERTPQTYKLSELKNKEVINITTGEKLGFVDDAEMETLTARLTSLIICGRERLWGLLGKDEDIVVRCRDIKVIGKDTILINPQEEHTVHYASSTNSKKFIFQKS